MLRTILAFGCEAKRFFYEAIRRSDLASWEAGKKKDKVKSGEAIGVLGAWYRGALALFFDRNVETRTEEEWREVEIGGVILIILTLVLICSGMVSCF